MIQRTYVIQGPQPKLLKRGWGQEERKSMRLFSDVSHAGTLSSGPCTSIFWRYQSLLWQYRMKMEGMLNGMSKWGHEQEVSLHFRRSLKYCLGQ